MRRRALRGRLPRYGAANLLIPGCGHLTICRDTRLIRSLVPELIRTEIHAGTFKELTGQQMPQVAQLGRGRPGAINHAEQRGQAATRSQIAARPWPPPMHMVSSP